MVSRVKILCGDDRVSCSVISEADRIRQKADGQDDAGGDGQKNDPESRFFVVHHRFYTLLYPDLAEGERAGRNSAAVHTARDKGLHIVGPLPAVQMFDHFFVARQLDIPAQQHIAEPQQGIEPVDRQQQKAQRLPHVIPAAQMCLFVGDDLLPVAAVHVVGQIDPRPEHAEHER